MYKSDINYIIRHIFLILFYKYSTYFYIFINRYGGYESNTKNFVIWLTKPLWIIIKSS